MMQTLAKLLNLGQAVIKEIKNHRAREYKREDRRKEMHRQDMLDREEELLEQRHQQRQRRRRQWRRH